MIKSVRLINFKCFEAQNVAFKPLTMLAGLNSSGKSTIIQSLLLLRQSYLENLLPQVGLALNGKLTQLGTARDVLFEEADTDLIGFDLVDDLPASLQLRLEYKEESDVLALTDFSSTGDISKIGIFSDDWQYLRAERVGPRTAFAMSDYEARHHRQLGAGGEFTVHFLSLFGADAIGVEALSHPRASNHSLQAEVEAWMSEISPGMRLKLRRYSEMDLVTFNVSYLFGHQVASAEYRPTNVGFGITYALPIVVAILSARPGALLVIENPEAHLHPRGQVKMGELFSRAAAAGIQIVTETHSDHVLNGIRLAVKAGQSRPGEVALYHSKWEPGAKSPSITPITIDESGRLDTWPEGFFDEIERSLDLLLGVE